MDWGTLTTERNTHAHAHAHAHARLTGSHLGEWVETGQWCHIDMGAFVDWDAFGWVTGC